MKPKLFLFALIVSFTTNISGQTLAIADQSSQHFVPYFSSNFAAHKHTKAGSIVLISVGGGTMCIAGVVTLLGALTCYSAYGDNTIDQNTIKSGRSIEIAGVVLGGAGLGMLIAGAVGLRAYHNAKWGIIAPKNNEIGFAYNF